MPSKILVGTDFRAQADRAIDRAIQLGKQFNAKVIVAHAVEPDFGQEVDFAAIEARMRSVLPSENADVALEVPEGPAHKAIADLAIEYGADLLVMGVARHKSFSDFVLGTITDRLLRQSKIPVLVVKARPQRPYSQLVCATDFHAPSRDAAIHAAGMFPALPLALVHAYHVPFEGWQKAEYLKEQVRDAEKGVFDDFLQEFPEHLHGRLEQRLVYGSPRRAICKVAQDISADLVVLGTHGESGFRHATIGSTANELLQSLPMDTLVIRK